jgi:hypothetical protein
MGVGLVLSYGGSLGPGSANLTITETIQWPGTFGGEEGWPVAVWQSPVSAIPDGSYSGNFHDYIWIGQLDIRQSETWVKHDVPYYVFNWLSVGGSSSPVLTLEPGVTVLGAGAAWLYVGEHEPGAIRAIGTAASPIVFQGSSDYPGAWGGISILPHATHSTLFDHVIVENGGGAYPLFANFLFYVDLGPVIRNSIVRGSAGCGVIITGNPPWATDLTEPAFGNTFANNAGGNVCGP